MEAPLDYDKKHHCQGEAGRLNLAVHALLRVPHYDVREFVQDNLHHFGGIPAVVVGYHTFLLACLFVPEHKAHALRPLAERQAREQFKIFRAERREFLDFYS